MDFDDLDDALGPSLEDKRTELLEKQVPAEMPGAEVHVAPSARGFAPRSSLKVLYLHGPGSTEKMAQMQLTNMFGKCPTVTEMKLVSWEKIMGTIIQEIHEIHADPIVQAQFRPYGTEFCSYLDVNPYSLQIEAWGGIEAATERVRKEMKENGPYDGICGFDMGGNVAFNCARLAMEGDKDFQEKFHFLMLFSTTAPKENGYYPSGLLCKDEGDRAMKPLRPKAPLQLPVFMSFSKLEDDARSYINYEEMLSMIHPDYRTIYIHDQGHRPPNIQKGTEFNEVIEKFITSMQAGIRFKLNEIGNTPEYKDYWLPLNREPLPEVESDMPRRIFVITDPLGAHGPLESTAFDFEKNPAQELPFTRKIRFDLARQVRGLDFAEVESALKEAAGDMEMEVIHVTSDKLKDIAWHPTEKDWYGRWIFTDDVISLPWSEGRYAAEDLLEELAVSPMDSVGVIGIGTGAYIAMQLTEAIMRIRFTTPNRLFLVAPPTVLPLDGFPGMGWLADVPVRHLTAAVDTSGPHWMAQVATLGHFSQSLFTSKEELLKMLGTEATKMSDNADDFLTTPERLKEIAEANTKMLAAAFAEAAKKAEAEKK
mmetsp:Transcript_93858/g.162476  ORF Transcript_93858/g.162476 Transcript_93858/m.162476 type:complete len:594 (+) Transcript_93858:73-1854(+)